MAVQKKTDVTTEVDAETQRELDEAVNAAIDGLETPTEDSEAAAEPKDIADFHASSDDESMEETLATLKEEDADTEGPLHGDASNEEDDVNETSTDQDTDTETENVTENENGELTLSLTGNMTLRLRYQYEGNDVIIGFKDHALQVRMSDGTEFKIPVRKRHLKSVS